MEGAAIAINEQRVAPNMRTVVATDELGFVPVSYTHLRAHETVLDLVCRLLLEKKPVLSRFSTRSPTTTTSVSHNP